MSDYFRRMAYALPLLSFATGLSACGTGNSPTSPVGQPLPQAALGSILVDSTKKSCLSSECLYVASQSTGLGDAINVYLASASGDVAPVQSITGATTDLSNPYGVAVDSDHVIYAINRNSDAITVYAAGAHGNVAPTREIAGSFTDLAQPAAVTLSGKGRIYVANSVGQNAQATITVYTGSANGNVPPIQDIAGPKTGLIYPGGIALDGQDNIYVSYYGSIAEFAANPHGNVAPIRNITGSKTGLGGGGGIALDAAGDIYAASGSSLLVFAPSANGNVAPIRDVSGSQSGFFGAYGLALDSKGAEYVSNYDNGGSNASVVTFRPNANGNVPPLRVIIGAKSKLQGPLGIAVL
jgi:hypothetical protein